jgi:organic hydroperoxide reductase OsmC/OhrA
MSSTAPAVRAKTHTFPVTVEWLAGRCVSTHVSGKQHVAVGPPLVFGGTDAAVWSPEDFVVAAVSSCLAVTLTGLAGRRGLHLSSLRVEAEGDVGARDDGRYGFTRVRLTLRAIVPPAEVELAEQLVRRAEETCLVAASLDLPVSTTFDVRAAAE